jgi:eukaryotic-like serine/threonine-protein kinase
MNSTTTEHPPGGLGDSKAPAAAAAKTPPVPPGQGATALERLVHKISQDADFPAMSAQIMRVYQLAGGENESVHRLTDEILKDVALTNKLLRIVNSAQYAGRAGKIGTVSRAISLLGFSAVRNIALSLVLLEHMGNHGHARRLRQEFQRALFAATLAAELCPAGIEREEVFLGALLQGLGRMLVACYFPEEAAAIEARTAGEWAREPTVVMQILGVGYDRLGVTVARSWGLPDHTLRMMEPAVGAPPTRVPTDALERMRWAAVAAHDMVGEMAHAAPEEWHERVNKAASRFAPVLGSATLEVQQALQNAQTQFHQTATAIGLEISGEAAVWRKMLAGRSSDASPAAVTEMDAEAAAAAAENDPGQGSAADWLARGVQDVSAVMLEKVPPSTIHHMVLESIYRALACKRVVLCLQDARSKQTLTGRLGIGADVDGLSSRLRVDLLSKDDLFSIVCRQGKDTHISDASNPKILQRLPEWLRQKYPPKAMLVLPLSHGPQLLGMIYAELPNVGLSSLSDAEGAMLKALRNVFVMALAVPRP